MNYLLIFLTISIISCKKVVSTKVTDELKKSNCEIKDYRDQKITGRDKVIGLTFLCNDQKDSSTYLFQSNNPFRKLGLKEINVDDQKGTANFDLESESFKSLNSKLGNQLSQEFSQIKLTKASSILSADHDTEFATVLTYLNVLGYVKPNVESSIYSPSQLIVLDNKGNEIYNQLSTNYLLTNPGIEKESNLLFFNRKNSTSKEPIEGFEIVDLTSKQTIYEYSLLPNFKMSGNILKSANYIVFEGKKWPNLYFYAYNIKTRKLSMDIILQNQGFIPLRIEGEKLILLKTSKDGKELKSMLFSTFKEID